MTASDVLVVLEDLEALGVTAWVDGGWGVDALLGDQSRDHDDLDLALHRDALGEVVDLLEDQGFVVERDLRPTALALRHPDGRAVDLHPVECTEDGGGDQALPHGEQFHYGAPVTGVIGGRTVACCSVETQVATHQGYEPDLNDSEDMRRLAERFGLSLRPPYGETRSRT
jgi:lincosamide nucleotidyltransferase A/C/D/E